MGHYCHVCGGMRPNEKFSGRGHAKHICRDCEREARAERRAKLKESPPIASPLVKHSWGFKRYLRANAFGWRSSALACKRLAEATKEVLGVAKQNPVLACEGAVALCERIWPAFQSVDTSSGALGAVVNKTTAEMVSLLADAPASEDARRRSLETLFAAVQEDGVDYLCNLRESWGRLCASSNLAGEWADRTLPVVQRAFSERETFAYTYCDSICLSCLLESARYDEMRSLLDLARGRFWHHEKYWAEALKRQGRIDDAVAYAESMLKTTINDGPWIMEFCEGLLIESGREDEAYERYGLMLQREATYLNRYRAVKRRYPNREPRGILLDLIGLDDEPGRWFAAAFRSGYTDIALDCARHGIVDPKTLIRAAQSSRVEDPAFAAVVAYRALELILAGHGYEITRLEVSQAFNAFVESGRKLKEQDKSMEMLRTLIAAEEPPGDFAPMLQDLLARSFPHRHT